MALGFFAAQVQSPKNCNLAVALHQAALSGNASLIATFSSCSCWWIGAVAELLSVELMIENPRV